MNRMEESDLDDLAYYDGETPNMVAIKEAYHSDVNDNDNFYERMEDSYKVRRNIWPGKHKSLKKMHPSAKPWQYASDNEAWVIDPRIDSLVSYAYNAWERGEVFAGPVGSDDLERASSITNFMRYTMHEWVPNPKREFKLAANYILEKGIVATYVGYEKYNQPIKELIDLKQINEQLPEFAELLADPDREDEAIEQLRTIYEEINEKRAKKALKQLRKTGKAEMPSVIKGVDRPIISTKAMEAEVYFPLDTIDPDRARRCHVVCLMSAQELTALGRQLEWDEELIEDIIENHMGVTQVDIDGQNSTENYGSRDDSPQTMELTPIVRTFLRQTDEEDGAMGIYEVIWSPRTGQDAEDPKYLSYRLLNGLDSFPVAVTTLRNDAKRMYESSRSLCDNLRGLQRNIKVLTDGMIDNISINMDPPRYHPPQGAPSKWGASTSSPIRRGTANDYGIFETKDMSRSSTALEEFFDRQADKIAGLAVDDPVSMERLQMFISIVLEHWEKVCKLVWRQIKEYGPEEKMFRITGDPSIAPQTFQKGDSNEGLDIRIVYDVRMNDPEYREKLSQSLIGVLQVDTEGVGNRREAINALYRINLPGIAPRIVQSADASKQEVEERVANDVAKLQAKIPVNAVGQGAQIALQWLSMYEQQPDVAMQLQQDMGFAQRYMEYKQQYEMFIQQNVVNAQIGRNINPNAMAQSANV